MSNVRQALVFCAVLAALPAVHATPLGEGLRLNDPLPEGPSWQTRLAALPAPLLLPGEAMAGAAARAANVRSRAKLQANGGHRAAASGRHRPRRCAPRRARSRARPAARPPAPRRRRTVW